MTIPGIEFIKGTPETLEQDSYFDVNIRNLIVIDDQRIEWIASSKLECHLHCAKPVPSRQRQSKQELKQPLFGSLQEPPRQTSYRFCS